MNLEDSVATLPHVGPYFINRLKAVGVTTVRDLLFHFPHRYENFALQTDIATAQPGEVITIKGQIIDIKNVFTRNGKKIQTATVSDGEGQIEVTWFNQIYLPKSLPPGTWVSLSGKLQVTGKKRKLIAPQWEKITAPLLTQNSNTIHTGRLVPVYPETSGLSSKWLRNRMASLLPQTVSQIEDYLPEKYKQKYNLTNLEDALKTVHFPESLDDATRARRRLAFDEFFQLQLNSLYRKETWKEKMHAHPLKIDEDKVLAFIENLPFPLTSAQTRSIREILADMAKDEAMNRLLEGDVGSGKTIVAAVASYVAIENGLTAALMAPTQILATQHFKTIKKLLEPYGITVSLITAAQSKKEKAESIKNSQVYVGTHALLSQDIDLSKLALVVIDEQHRFGVKQRALLASQGRKKSPHILTMTATPIPRTVALTMYGDLDLSLLDVMPKGRLSIKTWVVPPQKREGAYSWIREQVKGNENQAFIVCPFIEESDKDTNKSVKAATVEFERLSKEVFPDLKLMLLHGKIKGKEKDKVMDEFKQGKADILVATPVVEVGIDIPTATIMMIEGAERFGLAQLHQLRGRVGRGSKQSYCLLMTESKNPKTMQRLKALEQNLGGAQLAELDLELRGPGEVYGTAQSGFPELKVGSFGDFELIRAARETAQELLPQIDKLKQLESFLEEQKTILPN